MIDEALTIRDLQRQIEEQKARFQREVAGRERVEQALRESEEQYRQLVELAPVLIAVHRDGEVLFINQAGLQLVDATSPDQIVGKPMEAFVKEKEAAQKRVRRLLQAGDRSPVYEHKLLRLDGTEIDVEIVGTRLVYQGKQAVQIIARDVTERKRVEESQREQREWLEDLVQERTADLEAANEQLYQANSELSREITRREQVEETLRQRNLDLDLLNQAGRTFNSILDLDQVLAKVLETVRDLLGVLDGSIWLLDEQTGELVCRYLSNPQSEGVRGWRLPLGQGVAGWAAENGQSVLVEDTSKDARYFANIAEHVGMELGSLLTTPLWDQQEVFGVLQVVDTKVGRFDASDLYAMEALAATASIAIRNARLYVQTRRDAETKETLLREVNHRVMNTLTAIMGILDLEAGRPHWQTISLEEILQGVQGRIRGLATVHNLLSRAHWSPLCLDGLVSQVIQAALSSSPIANRIKVVVTPLTEPLLIVSQQATGLALIVNELMTNSIKHAFRGRDWGRIDVRLTACAEDGGGGPGKIRYKQVTLEFRDDGPGWPDDVLRGERESVGLNLIRMTIRGPLHGQLVLSNGDDAERVGAVAKLTFRHISTRSAD